MGDQLQRLRAIRTEATDFQESEEEDLEGVFGLLRGIKERATMLEFRFKTGDSAALNYGWLEKIEFNPSSGIRLHFGTTVVRLRGRGLNQQVRQNVTLLSGLLQHRISWVKEASQHDSANVTNHVPLITSIELS